METTVCHLTEADNPSLQNYRQNCNFQPDRPGARIASLGGAEINFGRAGEVYLCEFERGTGAREIYSSVDQTNKVKTKKKVFSSKISTNSGNRLKILAIFHEFLSEDKKKDLQFNNFHKFWLSFQINLRFSTNS